MNTEAYEKRTILYYAKQAGSEIRPFFVRDDETALRTTLESEGYQLNGPVFQVWEHDDDAGQRIELFRGEVRGSTTRESYLRTPLQPEHDYVKTTLGYVYPIDSIPAELARTSTVLYGARVIGLGDFHSPELHQVQSWEPRGSQNLPGLGCPRVLVPERRISTVWTQWQSTAPHQLVELVTRSPESGWGRDIDVPFGVGELIEFCCDRQLDFKPGLSNAIQIFQNGAPVTIGPSGDRTSAFAEGPGCNDGRIVLVNNNLNETGVDIEYTFNLTVGVRNDNSGTWYRLDPKIINRFKTF